MEKLHTMMCTIVDLGNADLVAQLHPAADAMHPLADDYNTFTLPHLPVVWPFALDGL